MLLLGIGLIYLFGMFNHGLIPSMEPRFAEVLKEMLDSGQYLVPIKNGIPYVEYPPLYSWLGLAASYTGLPVEAAIRLPGYTAFLLWILWLARLQRLVMDLDWPDFALALAGASLPAALYHFFTAQSDSLLILGSLIAYVGFCRHRLSQDESSFSWELWLGVALASAAKGPVGIACTLPAMLIEILLAAFTTVNGQPQTSWWVKLHTGLKELRRMSWLRGLTLILLINSPWYLITGITQGSDFVRAVLIYQNFERFVTGFDHLQPWWYYLKTLLYDFFPASLLVPSGIFFAIRSVHQFPYRLALVWALWTLLFFSISASKQGKYLLPAAPAFLLLAFVALDALKGKPIARHAWLWWSRWSATLIIFWGLIIIAILPFYSDQITHSNGYKIIRETINKQPGRIIHFHWPRSLTLYNLGAPMDYVRSSREFYKRMGTGSITAGDYLLIRKQDLPLDSEDKNPLHFSPVPAKPYFEKVLEVQAKKEMLLYRVLDNAQEQKTPITPVPLPILWRDKKFDTD